MPKLPKLRVRPRSWRDLFAATPPPDAAAWLSVPTEPDPSPKDFWPQLAKAADPKFERPAEVHTLRGQPKKAEKALEWKAKTLAPKLAKIMVEADLATA